MNKDKVIFNKKWSLKKANIIFKVEKGTKKDFWQSLLGVLVLIGIILIIKVVF